MSHVNFYVRFVAFLAVGAGALQLKEQQSHLKVSGVVQVHHFVHPVDPRSASWYLSHQSCKTQKFQCSQDAASAGTEAMKKCRDLKCSKT